MHDTMRRLLDYAKRTTTGSRAPVVSFADIGTAMSVSSAVLSNWKTRGISKDGAIKAAATFGCSVHWVLTGEGPQAESAPHAAKEPEVAHRYGMAARQQILDDLDDLLPEDAVRLVAEIHALAEKMRRHRDYLQSKAGHGPVKGAAGVQRRTPVPSK